LELREHCTEVDIGVQREEIMRGCKMHNKHFSQSLLQFTYFYCDELHESVMERLCGSLEDKINAFRALIGKPE
jgi:CTP:phosphocholine cytidylyltransferase-like protein